MSDKKKFPSLSADSRLVYNRLKAANVGDTIPYAELSQIVGRNVQTTARSTLDTARRMAMREDRYVFGVSANVGLVRLDDCSIVDFGSTGAVRARRAIRKSARVLGCVADFNAMPNDKKIQHNAMLSLYGALYEAVKPSGIAKVELAVDKASGELPMRKTLELFAQ
jgi:hypothetical protein